MATKPTVPVPATVNLSDIKPTTVKLTTVKPTEAKPVTLKPVTAKPAQISTPVTVVPVPKTVVAVTKPAAPAPEPDKKDTPPAKTQVVDIPEQTTPPAKTQVVDIPEQTTPPAKTQVVDIPEEKEKAPTDAATATPTPTKPKSVTIRPVIKTPASKEDKPIRKPKPTAKRHPETDLLCPKCKSELKVKSGKLPETCPGCGFILRAKRQKAANHNFELAFRKAWVLRGRATRREFWGFSIIMGTIGILLATAMDYVCNGAAISLLREYMNIPALPGMAQYILAAMLGAAILIWVVALPLPLLTLTIRRLHDVGRSMLWPAAVILCVLAAAAASTITGILLLILGSMPDQLLYLGEWGSYAAMGLGVLAIILVLVILMFCLMDSQRGTNQYGPSAKYPLE